MDALDMKLNDVFAGKVVRKDLVRKVKVGANIPVFVLEYLLGKYCATEDQAAIEVQGFGGEQHPGGKLRAPRGGKQGPVPREGKGTPCLYRQGEGPYVSDDDKHWAECVNFATRTSMSRKSWCINYDRLLMGGIGGD